MYPQPTIWNITHRVKHYHNHQCQGKQLNRSKIIINSWNLFHFITIFDNLFFTPSLSLPTTNPKKTLLNDPSSILILFLSEAFIFSIAWTIKWIVEYLMYLNMVQFLRILYFNSVFRVILSKYCTNLENYSQIHDYLHNLIGCLFTNLSEQHLTGVNI